MAPRVRVATLSDATYSAPVATTSSRVTTGARQCSPTGWKKLIGPLINCQKIHFKEELHFAPLFMLQSKHMATVLFPLEAITRCRSRSLTSGASRKSSRVTTGLMKTVRHQFPLSKDRFTRVHAEVFTVVQLLTPKEVLAWLTRAPDHLWKWGHLNITELM